MRCWQSRGCQDRIRHLWLFRSLHGRKFSLRNSSVHMSRMIRADTFGCDVRGFQGSPYVGELVDCQKNQGRGVGCETKVKPRWRVNRSRVAYHKVWDWEMMCGHDKRFGKCSGRFQKRPHKVRVRNTLENPGHPPAVEESGSCWKQCTVAGTVATRVL